MRRTKGSLTWLGAVAGGATFVGALIVTPGCGGSGGSGTSGLGPNGGTATKAQILQGRQIVMTHACAVCHAQGKTDPSSSTWLAGYTTGPEGVFQLGPFTVYAANLTPDATGLANVTPLQIFNELRHGLDPKQTPSVVITGDTPGQGNFPATPHYLAPIMPWSSFRHMTDSEIWAVAAYLKFGVKPVVNSVPAGSEPPDFWASSVTDAAIGPKTIPPYPAAGETGA